MTKLFMMYVVVLTMNGSQNVEVARFETFEQCSHFLNTSYHRIKKEYPLKENERITGAGCRNVNNGK